jgi:hypothetical protein
MRSAVLALGLVATPASADPCAGVEPALRKISSGFVDLADRGSSATVTCIYHGRDAKLTADLVSAADLVGRDQRDALRWQSCTVNPAGRTVPDLLYDMQMLSVALSMAYEACDPKLRQPKTRPPAPAGTSGTGCAELESWSRAGVTVYTQLVRRANELTVTCALRGPDDTGLPSLAKAFRHQIEEHTASAPTSATCGTFWTSPQSLWRTQQIDLAPVLYMSVASCSSKIHDRMRALTANAAKGDLMSDPAIKAELDRYVLAAFPKLPP